MKYFIALLFAAPLVTACVPHDDGRYMGYYNPPRYAGNHGYGSYYYAPPPVHVYPAPPRQRVIVRPPYRQRGPITHYHGQGSNVHRHHDHGSRVIVTPRDRRGPVHGHDDNMHEHG